jgi:hypothetical protein
MNNTPIVTADKRFHQHGTRRYQDGNPFRVLKAVRAESRLHEGHA